MLSLAAGSYRERPVDGALRDHFACIWVHRLPRPDVQPVVIVPDGCIDLEWIDGILRMAAATGRARHRHRPAEPHGVGAARLEPAHAQSAIALLAASHRC